MGSVTVISMSGLKNAGLTIIAGLAFICSPERLGAQTKQTESVQQTWFGYFNQTRFNNKLGLWVDVHLRTKEDFITDFSQALGRIGLTYYLSDDVNLLLAMPMSIIFHQTIIRIFHSRSIVPGNSCNGIPIIRHYV